MEKITIGRSQKCDVTLEQSNISNQHAEIFRDQQGTLWIVDLQSTNGTFVDGVLISQPAKLSSKSLVLLADYIFDWQSVVENLLTKEELTLQTRVKEAKNAGDQRKRKKIALLLFFAGIMVMLLLSQRRETLSRNGEIKETSLDVSVVDSDKNQASQPAKTAELPHQEKQDRRPMWVPVTDPIIFDYSCLYGEDGFGELVQYGGDLQQVVVELSGKDITIEDEHKVGEEVKDDILAYYKIWNDTDAKRRTETIFNELVRTIDNPRGIRYELFMIDSDDVNAFTIGGKVFVFRGIYEIFESDDELAAVLSHEIQHNERGHLTRMLKKEALAEELFGEAAMIPILADKILFASFGQKDEAECDLHGVSHIVRLGYNGCAAAELWDRFAEAENNDALEGLLRSHPYSKDRKACIVAHINTNYGRGCR